MLKSILTLTPDELDFAVAKAERLFYMRDSDGQVFEFGDSGKVTAKAPPPSGRMFLYIPTRDWRQAGPIIERLGISLQKIEHSWIADIGRETMATGASPLEAAMRARVMAAFGREIDLSE